MRDLVTLLGIREGCLYLALNSSIKLTELICAVNLTITMIELLYL